MAFGKFAGRSRNPRHSWRGGCQILTFIIGFGAMVLVGQDVVSGFDKGGNMAALLLAELVGGSVFLGFIAAVAFATILAVVAGLTLSGAVAISHDLYVNVFRQGTSDSQAELKIVRLATVGLSLFAIALGLVFKGQNVAFMVGLAFAIAASANFPALLLSIMWRRLSTRGATASILVGAVSAVLLIALSPTVMIDILGQPAAIFPLKNPALISIPLAFLTAWIVSAVSPEPEAAELFDSEKLRCYLGIGAE